MFSYFAQRRQARKSARRWLADHCKLELANFYYVARLWYEAESGIRFKD